MDNAGEGNWEPSKRDIQWCRDILGIMINRGLWTSSNAIYQVDHEARTLTKTVEVPGYQPHLHERNRKAFAAVGYEVKP